MLATVFTKSIQDRWRGMAIGAGVVALFLLYGMAVYRSIDLSIYTDLPDAYLSLFGIPEGADAGSLAYGAVYGFAGGLTLAALALSIGSGSIAGEERNGTIGLLLGNPKTRTHLLVSKAGSIVVLTGLGSLVLWGAGLVVPSVLDVNVTGIHVEAQVFHIFVNAVFYGFLAAAVGAWTGNKGLASGVTAGVMIVSYFAAGLFPVIEGLENVAKVFPWYYFEGGDPVANGVVWGHIGVLAGSAAVFLFVAVVGLNKRDLRGQTTGVTLLDRLRANPTTKKIADRIGGSTRVSRVWIKTASEHQGLTFICAITMFAMGALIGPMYALIDESIKEFADQLPEALLAMVGNGDMGTPEGFFQIEIFSLMAPISVMIVTMIVGARAMAGEEERRTIGLLLANPIKRSTMVLEKTFSMIVLALAVGLVTFVGATFGSFVGRLGMSVPNIAAISVLVTLLGLVFGALTLAIAAATGRVKTSVYVTIGAALTFYLLNSFLPLNDSIAGYARWSPFYYYLTSDPLNNGMPWGHAAVLVGLFAALVAASVWMFDRRDLRQTG